MAINQNQAVQVEFETPRISNEVVDFITTLKVGDYVTKVALFEHQELRRITRFQQNVPIPTQDQIEAYLVTLLDIRVKIARRENLGDIGRYLNQLRVPARWYVLLAQVGEAMDASRRFKFYPELDLTIRKDLDVTAAVKAKGAVELPKYQLLNKDDMLEISQQLEFFYEEGYASVPGVPRDPEGSLQFMSKTTAGNIIRGMDKDNPAYAFLAFILENEVAAESYDNLDLVFRINYSSYDTYSAAFKSYFVQSTNTLGGNANADRPEEPTAN